MRPSILVLAVLLPATRAAGQEPCPPAPPLTRTDEARTTRLFQQNGVDFRVRVDNQTEPPTARLTVHNQNRIAVEVSFVVAAQVQPDSGTTGTERGLGQRCFRLAAGQRTASLDSLSGLDAAARISGVRLRYLSITNLPAIGAPRGERQAAARASGAAADGIKPPEKSAPAGAPPAQPPPGRAEARGTAASTPDAADARRFPTPDARAASPPAAAAVPARAAARSANAAVKPSSEPPLGRFHPAADSATERAAGSALASQGPGGETSRAPPPATRLVPRAGPRTAAPSMPPPAHVAEIPGRDGPASAAAGVLTAISAALLTAAGLGLALPALAAGYLLLVLLPVSLLRRAWRGRTDG